MGRVHKSYRLKESTVDAVAEWAEAHGKTATQAMDELLERATRAEADERAEAEAVKRVAELEGQVSTLEGQIETLKIHAEAEGAAQELRTQHISDLRATVATLTAQVTEKDEQIRRLTDLAEHAQMLQAAQVQQIAEASSERTDGGAEDAHEGDEDGGEVRADASAEAGAAPASWRRRLARWISGEGE